MDEAAHSQEDLDLMTVEEVARQLRVSPKTVRGWLVQGRLSGFKLTPKVWRIPREEFQAFVTAAKRQTDEPMERSGRAEHAERSTDKEH
jgi:excisionase family DNA binding protein